VKQEYLPEKVKSRIYYRPTGRGFEKEIKARMEELAKKKE
jgi:replication-associated recombination protein RarA